MSRVYVTSFVPAAVRVAAEAAVEPLLQSPNNVGVFTFSVPLVPLGGDDDAAATHYGCCAPMLSEYIGSLDGLVAAFPGSAYQSIPWRSFDNAVHWTGCLAGHSLKPQVLPMGS